MQEEKETITKRDSSLTKMAYISMVQYIKSLLPVLFETKIDDVVDPEEEIEKLDKFYDGELNGYFSRYQI